MKIDSTLSPCVFVCVVVIVSWLYLFPCVCGCNCLLSFPVSSKELALSSGRSSNTKPENGARRRKPSLLRCWVPQGISPPCPCQAGVLRDAQSWSWVIQSSNHDSNTEQEKKWPEEGGVAWQQPGHVLCSVLASGFSAMLSFTDLLHTSESQWPPPSKHQTLPCCPAVLSRQERPDPRLSPPEAGSLAQGHRVPITAFVIDLLSWGFLQILSPTFLLVSIE